MSRFVRKGLRNLEPYAPGEQPRDRSLVKLNTNENPYPPSPAVVRALAELDADALRRYPDPSAFGVREAAAEVFGCDSDQVIVGNGSDELLRLCLTAFVEPGSSVVLPDITYSLYATLIAIQGARANVVPLAKDYSYSDEMIDAHGSIMFLCHPNAPTGLPLDPRFVEACADRFSGVLVIDEAYADFAQSDYVGLARGRDDVVVLRTMSKSYGLAGMRVGIGLGAADLIGSLSAVKDSYNLSVADQVAATAALRDRAYFRQTISKIKSSRERLEAGLRELGFVVFPSSANFVFVRVGSKGRAQSLWAGLRREGVLVRYFDKPRIDDALRISVGTDDDVDNVLARLSALARS